MNARDGNRMGRFHRICLRLLLATLAGAGIADAAHAQSAIFMVRHAEKLDESDDPPLSPAGRARAEALAKLVRDAGIKAIYVTQYQRTTLTAAPLAEALGLEPITIHSDASAELIERMRRDHPNDAVLLVGHSGSVPRVLKLLGHAEAIEIGHDEYDSLFIAVPKPGGAPSVLRLRF